jgi:Zn-dependent protease with chaperone function
MSFRQRQFLYSSVLMLTALYVLSPPSLIIRLTLLAAIGVAAYLTFTFFAMGLVMPPLKLYLSGKKPVPTELPEIREVAAKLGVTLPEHAFSYTEEDFPAVTNGYTKRMVLNRGLWERLTPDERRFVGGHEVAHITDRWKSQAILMAGGIGSSMAVALPLAFLGFSVQFIILPAFSAMIIIAYFAQRRAELHADLGGARFVPYEIAESAMRKVYGNQGMDWASDTHPSGSSRLKNLRKYYEHARRRPPKMGALT